MQISTADLQNLMPDNGSGALVLKSGEQVTVDFVRKLESGMFILNVNGKSIAASIDFDPANLQTQPDGQQNQFPAVIIKTPQGIQLKIFEPLIQFAQTQQNGSPAPAYPQNSQNSVPSAPQTVLNQTEPEISGQQTQNTAPAAAGNQSSASQPQTATNAPNTLSSQIQPAQTPQTNTEQPTVQQNISQPQQTTGNQPVPAETSQASGQTTSQPEQASQTQPSQTQVSQNQAAQPNPAQTQQTDDSGQPKLIGTAFIKQGDPNIIVKNSDQQIGLSNIKLTPQEAKQTAAQQSLGNARILAAVSESDDGTTMTLTLPKGAIEAADGERVDINVLKTADDGKTLISVKGKLFEADLPPQVFKDLRAQVKISPQDISLVMTRQPVENLPQAYVKQQITGFDLESVLKAFGKFSKVSMDHITADDVKTAIKNSGLFMENKLSKDGDVSGDEKFRALLNMDTPAKDGITRMQVTNLMMAGGMLAFLKTRDENVSDTFVRYKKGKNGNDTVYVSTEFSELGDTLIIIKPVSGTYNITIKTEKDISEDLAHLNLEKGSMRWYKLDKKDLDVMNPKNDIASDMGRFEVII